jgi:predicted nucleic acid-binding Zn ribbon protein
MRKPTGSEDGEGGAAWWDIQDHLRRYGRNENRPKSLLSLVNKHLAKRGYNQSQATEQWEEIWRKAADGQWGQHTKVKRVTRGTLEVLVDNPAVLQQLTFQKAKLLKKVQELGPAGKVTKLKLILG